MRLRSTLARRNALARRKASRPGRVRAPVPTLNTILVPEISVVARFLLGSRRVVPGFVQPSRKTVQQNRRPKHCKGEEQVALGGSAAEPNPRRAGQNKARGRSGGNVRGGSPNRQVTVHEKRKASG